MNDNASPAPAGVSRQASPLNPWLFVALAALGLAGWQWFETRERLLDTQQEIARRLGEADDADKEARGALHHLEEQVADLQARNGALETRVAEFQGQTAALQGLYQDISRARDEAASVDGAARDASDDVERVAAASEQLTASIAEIRRQVEESSGISVEAVGETKASDAIVGELSDSAGRIGGNSRSAGARPPSAASIAGSASPACWSTPAVSRWKAPRSRFPAARRWCW